MSFPRYPEYKDSGVKWLGEVPAHWAIDRIKRSIKICRNGIWGDEAQGDALDIPCVRVADFDRTSLTVRLVEPTIRNITEKEREGRVLQRGNLLLEKSGGGELQPVGCVVLYDHERPAVCSNFVARMEVAEGMSPSYWRYLHAAAYAVRLNVGSINQTSGIQNLDQGRYLDERVAFPPLDEQRSIAEFLEKETAKIDGLVNEQEKLIALLKEKRQSVISHAVTKGLDPNVPMKDSGIEWLGEVPAHWEVRSLKHFWTVTDCKHITAEFVDDGIPLASIRESQSRYVALDDAKRTTAEYYEQLIEGGRKPAPGDLVFTRNATVGEVAQVAEWHPPFALGQDVCLLRRLEPAASADFMQAALQSGLARAQMDLAMIGSTFKRINVEEIRGMVVPYPPHGEQSQIATHIEAAIAEIDRLVGLAEAGTSLLSERRSALISAAVTGKIDVRQIKATEAA